MLTYPLAPEASDAVSVRVAEMPLGFGFVLYPWFTTSPSYLTDCAEREGVTISAQHKNQNPRRQKPGNSRLMDRQTRDVPGEHLGNINDALRLRKHNVCCVEVEHMKIAVRNLVQC